MLTDQDPRLRPGRQQGAADLQDSGEATATFGQQATSAGTSAGKTNPDLTSPGSTLGTVAYMSPEQAKGELLDARTDLFSLGVVIHEMASGSKPFAGQSTAELFVALLTRDPAPVSTLNPAMPVALNGIVARLLAKEKEQRYQTAEELLQDLEAIDAPASQGSSGKMPSATSEAHNEAGAHPAVPKARTAGKPLLVAAVVIVLLAVAFAWWRHQAIAPSGTATAPANRSAPGATKNAIIVADFVNHTGDAVFETTLNQAPAVQLGQSPVLDIVSPQHLRQSIQYLGKKQACFGAGPQARHGLGATGCDLSE